MRQSAHKAEEHYPQQNVDTEPNVAGGVS